MLLGKWIVAGRVTNEGSPAEGLLMNVRMVNSTFEDSERPDFDPEANLQRFICKLPEYRSVGVNAVTLCLQGGMPGYENNNNSAFLQDGSLYAPYIARVKRAIEACALNGIAVILGLFYQRQSSQLRDEQAVQNGVVNALSWVQNLRSQGLSNVLIEIANEHAHSGFVHTIIRSGVGMASLLALAKKTAPEVLVTASGLGDGRIDPDVASACDFLTPHWNGTKLDNIEERIKSLKKYAKPLVCNEDDKVGSRAAAAMQLCVQHGCGYGLMLKDVNQLYPFRFDGAADDPVYYFALALATGQPPPRDAADAAGTHSSSGHVYTPPPESLGGWRTVRDALSDDAELEAIAQLDSSKLSALREWLLASDERNFAATIVRHGSVVFEVERGNSAATDSRRVASCSKAVCAIVLAIASEHSVQGRTPRRMTFGDRAFDYLPWANPLSDPRKAEITVAQLLNHTSGICPEATGAPNDGSWAYILGHTGDPRTAKLAFDPGKGCGYSTHALCHASLVCETVTGQSFDQFAIRELFQPLGIESWWFQFADGDQAADTHDASLRHQYGRHPTHGLGLPCRAMARIAYCMLHGGQWNGKQIIPPWFVAEVGGPHPTHDVTTPELRWGLRPAVFTHGWERPRRHFPDSEKYFGSIPEDAVMKSGSGGQLMAFVPSLDLVVTRQTGGSGEWQYEEFLAKACECVL